LGDEVSVGEKTMIGLAAAVAAFNLVCSGTTHIGDVKKEHQSAYAQTFRIDLDAQRWCWGKCETTEPIYSVSATEIMLKLAQDKAAGNETFISLNRENGAVLDRTKFNFQLFIMNTGKCEKAAFSGFPAKKF